MSLLFRYLTKNNAYILLPTLAVGVGLYILTDLFERLDNFIEADVPVSMIATYFLVKMPLVISQILPVIFLLSTVIQLCIMARSRELTALQAGGISLGVVAQSMILCGIFWSGVQLGFSEYLGVTGERESARIWQLGTAIEQLSSSGSNVENLRTAWHAKIAYAASILIMAFVATAIVSWKDNIYIAVTLALVCTFLYYALYTLGTSLGQRGLVHPFLAAWGANIIAMLCAMGRLIPVVMERK